MDGWMDGLVGGLMDGWMDGWVNDEKQVSQVLGQSEEGGKGLVARSKRQKSNKSINSCEVSKWIAEIQSAVF